MLFLYSAATHCIEWHEVPQNSLVPVAWTITWVPAVATNPTMTPASTSVRTERLGLGLVRPRHVRRMNPPFGSCAIGRPPLESVVDQEVQDVRGVPRLRVRAVQVAVLVGRAGDGVLVAVHLRVAVLIALIRPAAGEGPRLAECVHALQVEGFALGVVPRGDGQRPHHR